MECRETLGGVKVQRVERQERWLLQLSRVGNVNARSRLDFFFPPPSPSSLLLSLSLAPTLTHTSSPHTDVHAPPAARQLCILRSVSPRMSSILSSKHFFPMSAPSPTHGSTCRPESGNTSKSMRSACRRKRRGL